MSKTKLALAFKALRKAGIYARMNFSCCGGCGVYEIHQILKQKDPDGKKYNGYCFYHAQDNERMERGADCLYLQHGWYGKITAPIIPGPYAHIRTARAIVAILKQNGLKCEWNGNDGTCIKVIL